ncbi:DUF805 domain-containing protein [Sagittula sp. M10.9X]|uniref:DUF805 domain-containing protein n=2 Tax=Sagittula salina TaxID=2820268 RepID=A0A940RZU3_9RHOB|nr:DUF805 domain-containing protein [Sagittula salina]
MGRAVDSRNYQEDVSYGEALSRFFNGYIQFEGRSNRGEFWKAWLCCFGISILAGIVDSIIGMQVVSTIFSLAVLIPSIAIAARRLHDIDRSGWWMLIALIPVVGIIVLLVWYAKSPDPAPNRFG